MVLGDIYHTHWDDTIVRVIGFDDHQIFYDAWDTTNNSWFFSSNRNKSCYFYTSGRKDFEAKSTFIEHSPLSDAEYSFYKPELSIRPIRLKDTSLDLPWSDIAVHSLSSEIILATPQILLFPGKGNRFGKGHLIVANDSRGFFDEELLKAAFECQNETKIRKTNGIGIFRLGAKKETPSYYIGNYIDLAGIMAF